MGEARLEHGQETGEGGRDREGSGVRALVDVSARDLHVVLVRLDLEARVHREVGVAHVVLGELRGLRARGGKGLLRVILVLDLAGPQLQAHHAGEGGARLVAEAVQEDHALAAGEAVNLLGGHAAVLGIIFLAGGIGVALGQTHRGEDSKEEHHGG